MIWEHIDFSLDNPLLQDARVRRAIAHAINRTQIVQQVFLGKHQVSHTYLPPRHPGYTDAVQKYSHDPARSRRLLEEAGFRPGPDGVLRTATGERLELQFSTTPVPLRLRAQQIIQQQLRQVGIETSLVNLPPRILFDEMAHRRRFKGLMMYAWVMTPLDDCFELYTSGQIPTEQNGWLGRNYPGYRNSRMDEICYAASREVDEVRRNEYLRESAQTFSRDLPALPLWVRVDVAAAKVGLKNFRPARLSFTYETWNAHQWYWE